MVGCLVSDGRSVEILADMEWAKARGSVAYEDREDEREQGGDGCEDVDAEGGSSQAGGGGHRLGCAEAMHLRIVLHV